ncbi:GRIP1-associated protein 1 [Cottoperca gobio]|uniref:GRIP1-associated protein 1 n=1 Tax=Cottoperca gobio TaxID=56716 RepID=A0A6J2Q2B2_COTGO|nr:GRIP1-associated protein 1 [Cottoperca gobio]
MAMSQALSEEEFHRMQAQLLELRTQNYQLSDDLRKSSAELNAVRQKNVVLERDFVKAQKALNKSKKAQEVEALLSENEMLQGKLHSQEEDFRLQNSTLMTELSKLCTQIEQLEQENEGLKDGAAASASGPPPNPAPSPVDGELLHLQAENSTLQKKMKALQERYDKELQKQPVAQGNQSATTETDGSANGVSDVTGRGEEPAAEGTNERLEQTEARLEHKEKQLHGLSEKSVEKIVAKQAALGWSAALCPITHCFGPELEMALNTEQEEKRLMREQIHNLEASKQAEITKLQEELTKVTSRDHKKQESFQRLQGEKEALYNDSRTKIDEINQRKEEELKATNIRIQKLQSDVLAANQVTGELREQLQSKEREHELALHTLRDQVANQSAVSQEQVDNILQENDALRTNLAALEQIQTVKTQEMNLLREQQEALTLELQQRRVEQESLLAHRDDLDSQLQESSFASRKLLEQLTEEGHEKEKLLRDLDEAKKTAEKRKAMLDDMAVQLMQEKSDHKEALSDLKLQHEKEVLGVRARYEKELRGLHEDKNRSEEEIRQQLRDEKARTKELEGLQQRVEELQAQVQSMEGTKGWFERRLKEAEENIEKNSLEHQEEIERLQKEHTHQLLKLSFFFLVPEDGRVETGSPLTQVQLSRSKGHKTSSHPITGRFRGLRPRLGRPYMDME